MYLEEDLLVGICDQAETGCECFFGKAEEQFQDEEPPQQLGTVCTTLRDGNSILNHP
jgi:hypothetical protein